MARSVACEPENSRPRFDISLSRSALWMTDSPSSVAQTSTSDLSGETVTPRSLPLSATPTCSIGKDTCALKIGLC